MTHPFNIGDKVVCVDDRFDDRPHRSHLPNVELGKVYVIRRMRENPHNPVGVVGVFLVGFPDEDYGYKHTRFRKLSDIQKENRLRRMTKKPAVTPVDSMYP